MNVVNVVPIMPPKHLPPLSAAEPHVPVLAAEITAAVAPHKNGIYLDATLGAGGHTLALCSAGAGRVLGFDRDAAAVALARRRLARLGSAVELHQAAFSNLGAELARLGIAQVDGMIADLGVSSMQLDEAPRGMSFRSEGPLDMRMDPSCGETARALIARLDDDELAELIFKLGEERRARRVARCIKQEEAAGRLETTFDLRRAVVRAVGPARIGGVDPATRTFQALRIAVNAELAELEALIQGAGALLAPGGALCIISFHSLEDRMVKRLMRGGPWDVVTKKPIVPSDGEVDDNPRARSAKLRIARRRYPEIEA
jgi:16S rRNA (cytosine1402-N4)-methyltransferase